ncbi:substrate-binding domain-containing protein [Aestuariirhabdus sp. Z084]|uniref:substrate-binding domain-containing protein n=1 Tax=Aestuariirhabdus haliotis TaxID=2918751 RepID=UPI00201B3BA0|nr:substrate-binding domain-containing protein [Aestuariirhabdus haliotis]MCL6415509.1 substrate-binding domain-containing protein [Aestuariirhabdus haliotis]MCL6419286.1 substrate-binding domain-containing protein [Aestuariirhabdus haliotis]
MLRIFIAILLVCASSQGLAVMALKDYWTVEEYFQQHPEQQKKFVAFNRLVQRPGVPVTYAIDSPVKITIVYPGEQASDYWRRSVASFSARLEELKIPFEIDSLFTRPGTELAKQSKKIQQSLKADPDYLVFTLDALRHRTLLERIMAQSQTKIILQNITTPLKSLGDRQPFLYVGFDHQLGSQLIAEEYRKRFPDSARYGLLNWNKGYVSTMRGGSFVAALQSEGRYLLEDTYYVKYGREGAFAAAKNMLENRSAIDFIFAATTDIALGAMDYLSQSGKKQSIVVNGWGGGSAELESIANNALDFTVMRMNDDNGVAMAEAIKLDITQQGHQVPQIYSGAFKIITQETDPAVLSEIKKQAFRYSGE